MAEGRFDGLPTRGWINCSLSGDAFFAEWFRKKLAADNPAADESGKP
jgi:hypothetical protein